MPNETSDTGALDEFRVANEKQELVEDVYALTPIKAHPVALYVQQARALNLIWRLHNRKMLENKDVAVIGGGVAGVTAAAAAALCGARVVLFERSANLLPAQLGCHHRFLHPRIHEWPSIHSFMASAQLPVLNWFADSADQVARQLLRQFVHFRCPGELENGKVAEFLNTTVIQIARDGAKVKLAFSGESPSRSVDRVIVATGFSFDGEIPGLPPRPYWRGDALAQLIIRAQASEHRFRIAVIGRGDGGALDVLRARLIDFDHGPFLDRHLGALHAQELRGQIQNVIDDDALSDFLRGLKGDAWVNLQRAIRNRLRPDTEVYWYGKRRRCTGFLFHSFLLELLLSVDDAENKTNEGHTHVIDIGDQHVDLVQHCDEGFTVRFKGAGQRPPSRHFDDVIGRFPASGENSLARFGLKLQASPPAKYRLDQMAYVGFRDLKSKSALPASDAQLSLLCCYPLETTHIKSTLAEWTCYEIILTVTGAPHSLWVDYVLHPEEVDHEGNGELCRRVEAHGRVDTIRSLFTWNDYWVEARLDDGTMVKGNWLSKLLANKGDAGCLSAHDNLLTQAKHLFPAAPDPTHDRPQPKTRRADPAIAQQLIRSIHGPRPQNA